MSDEPPERDVEAAALAERIAQAHRAGAAEVTARVETLIEAAERRMNAEPWNRWPAMVYTTDLRAVLRGET